MARSKRLRDLGLAVGELPTGPTNSIVDVPGVRVSHCDVRRPAGRHASGAVCPEGAGRKHAGAGRKPIHTGVTVIVPGERNLFEHPLPAAVDVFNGYGKSAGLMQAAERGEIETPIHLTSTLNVGRVWDAALSVALEQNPKAISVSPLVMECNDGMLSDARGRHVGEEHVRAALAAASAEPPALGSVGAGSGMKCLGRKGGVGVSSRVVRTKSMGEVTLGVLSLNNFGGRLTWRGREIGTAGGTPAGCEGETPSPRDSIGGSCVIVLATNAPLGPGILGRLARRAWAGVARVGSSFGDTSGDIALAFAIPRPDGTCPDELRWKIPTDDANALFVAAADATEESIWDCLLAAGDFTSPNGKLMPGLKPEELWASARRGP